MKPTDAGDDRIARRTVLMGLATGLAGTVSSPVVTGAADAEQPERVESPQQPSAGAATGFLDTYQRQTLTSLAESLVPGAVGAGVVDLIDRVASVDAPARQRQLLNAIGQFEHEARTQHGTRWIDLTEAARLDILRQASTAPESRPPQPVWVKGEPMVFESPARSGPPTLRDHFEFLRTTIATAYYATEPGMKELGWTGQNAWRELPGCAHPNPAHE
jgi:hypothetical protein